MLVERDVFDRDHLGVQAASIDLRNSWKLAELARIVLPHCRHVVHDQRTQFCKTEPLANGDGYATTQGN